MTLLSSVSAVSNWCIEFVQRPSWRVSIKHIQLTDFVLLFLKCYYLVKKKCMACVSWEFYPFFASFLSKGLQSRFFYECCEILQNCFSIKHLHNSDFYDILKRDIYPTEIKKSLKFWRFVIIKSICKKFITLVCLIDGRVLITIGGDEGEVQNFH